MDSKYELYVLDTETTGLDPMDHSPVEISILRISNKKQKTWHLKPLNTDSISTDALRVNGLNLEDLLGNTKEGREKYQDPSKVLVEIENWLMDDFTTANDRIMVGHNVSFDKIMLEFLWKKCNSHETFPFSRRYGIDTFQLEFFLDLCKNESSSGYSLNAVTKKYGIINVKAHTAAADVMATAAVFDKQIDIFKNHFNK